MKITRKKITPRHSFVQIGGYIIWEFNAMGGMLKTGARYSWLKMKRKDGCFCVGNASLFPRTSSLSHGAGSDLSKKNSNNNDATKFDQQKNNSEEQN